MLNDRNFFGKRACECGLLMQPNVRNLLATLVLLLKISRGFIISNKRRLLEEITLPVLNMVTHPSAHTSGTGAACAKAANSPTTTASSRILVFRGTAALKSTKELGLPQVPVCASSKCIRSEINSDVSGQRFYAGRLRHSTPRKETVSSAFSTNRAEGREKVVRLLTRKRQKSETKSRQKSYSN